MSLKPIPSIEPPGNGHKVTATSPARSAKQPGCPHFFRGRCKILDAEVEELGKVAENYNEAAEDHAEGGETA